MQIKKRLFRTIFPNLAKEVESRENKVVITSVRSKLSTGREAASRGSGGYIPDVIDFLRRCDNDQQAEEIINYLEKEKEISKEYTQRLRKQLRERGLRSFGSKKGEDYYLK